MIDLLFKKVLEVLRKMAQERKQRPSNYLERCDALSYEFNAI